MSGMGSDLLLSPQPLLGTPLLARAVQDYRQFGFELCHQVPGVMAQLALMGLRVQLWQRGLGKGPALRERHRPERARAAVADVFALHAVLARRARASLSGTPLLQAWGAWECVLTDGDGNRLHLVQWLHPALPAPSNPWHTDPTAARPAPPDGR